MLIAAKFSFLKQTIPYSYIAPVIDATPAAAHIS
jgi:hypothetical protein